MMKKEEKQSVIQKKHQNKLYFVQLTRTAVSISSRVDTHCSLFSLSIDMFRSCSVHATVALTLVLALTVLALVTSMCKCHQTRNNKKTTALSRQKHGFDFLVIKKSQKLILDKTGMGKEPFPNNQSRKLTDYMKNTQICKRYTKQRQYLNNK